MQRTYPYVGPPEIAKRALAGHSGTLIETPEDVIRWMRKSGQELTHDRTLTATFIIDGLGGLRIADRRSEHVVCAGGKPVQTAGEITFRVAASRVEVCAVTNQSTGYCPEPGSWPAVEAALTRLGITASDGFSQAFHFRRCLECQSVNIVKDGVFECMVCSAPLPVEWNLNESDRVVFSGRIGR